MAHRQLDGTRTDPVFHAVRGVTMAEFVRKNRDAEFASGFLDGALDIGLMHPVADFTAGAGMETGMVGGEEPCPRPGELVIRVFDGELMGQGDGNFVLLIPLPDRLGKLHLLDEFGHERFGQGNDPVFAALGSDEKKRELFQVHILDSHVEGFSDAQPAAINHASDQIGGITGLVANGLEQGLSFGNGGGMTQAGRPFGAEGIHPLKGLAQDFLVKEKNGVEGLILAAGGQITMAGQIGQEAFQFLLAGKGGRHGVKGGHIMAEPIDVRGFGGEGLVLAAQDIAQPFDGDG